MARKIFISKPDHEVLELSKELALLDLDIYNHSFLSYEGIEFKLTFSYDIVFFGSPRAVHYFIVNQVINENALVACVGLKTAEALQFRGYKVDYISEKSGSVDEAAEKFKEWCGDKKVLFPISNISLKSFSGVFHYSQKLELEVYKTIITGKRISEFDVYVFSSPSNLDGFLEFNSIPSESKIIAWGESTKSHLEKNGLSADFTLSSSSLDELLTYLGQKH